MKLDQKSRFNTLQGQIPFKILALAMGLFVLEATFVLNASLLWLLGQANADDFYYYLVLARNSAAGLGPTFDGFHLTNGFHPLYLFLTTILATISGGSPTFLIKASMILLLLFHNATGLVIAAGFSARQDMGMLAGVLWLVNPWPLAITLHGVEAPIATFLWAIIIFTLLAYRRNKEGISQAITLGCLIGLAIWGRTDSLLLLGAILLTQTGRAWRDLDQFWPRMLWLVLMSGVAFMVTLPWWWWNWTHFGMLIQVSGKAIFLITHGFAWLDPVFMADKITRAGLGYGSRLLIYTAVPLFLALFAWRVYRPDWGRLGATLKAVLFELDFVWLAGLILILWYPGWQWNVQNWYLLSSILIATIGVMWFYQKLTADQAPVKLGPALGLVIFASLLFLGATFMTIGFGFPRQTRGYHIARWLNQHTEANAVVGAWNSGVIGYFADRPVINLDGVVNNEVYRYKVTHQADGVVGLMGYIRANEIDYLTDYENLFIGNPQALGVELVYKSMEHGFYIYRVRP